MPPRRKKWTEDEERTLIETYRDLLATGALHKLKTREKKFRPIAARVNSLHHSLDPLAFPWQWSWKDASTKVQNMRHQYLLVKQKIIKPGFRAPAAEPEPEAEEAFDWAEGTSYWPNFLMYKSVFGDLALAGFNSLRVDATNVGGTVDVDEHVDGLMGDLGEYGGFGVDGVMGLGYYEDGENDDNEENDENRRGIEECEEVFRRKRMKGAMAVFGSKFAEVREREAVCEEREAERERKRRRREQVMGKLEQERRRKFEEWEREREERERGREQSRRERSKVWEAMERESFERERRRREEEMIWEKEWEERMERRRLEWRNRIDGMLSRHRAAMDEMQTRILHNQQNLTNQMIGLLSQWSGNSGAISDHSGAGNPYLSQSIPNLHHMSGIVHSEENRDVEDNHDDQFIVDDG